MTGVSGDPRVAPEIGVVSWLSERDDSRGVWRAWRGRDHSRNGRGGLVVVDYKSQPWMNAHGQVAGRPAFVRKNVGLLSIDSAAFPHLALVSLLYRDVAADGRPADGDEWARLDSTEERIADAMQDRLGACFALCVTSGGSRDLFFFLSTAITDEEADGLIQAIRPSVDYEIGIVYDPEWRPYRELMPDPA